MGSSARSNESLLTTAAVPWRCPACFSRRWHVENGVGPQAGPWRLTICDECGQMYTNPRPSTSQWRELYPEDYGPYRTRIADMRRWTRRASRDRWLLSLCRPTPELSDSPLRLAMRAVVGLITRGLLDPRLVLPKGDGRLLDVGCGSGGYMARMRSLGWDVLGVDRSELAAERACQQWHVPVVVAHVPGPSVPEGPFDLITLWEVLEHLDRPRLALASLRDRLAPGGRLLLSVPNQGGWAARRFKDRWIGWDIPRHLVHFTETSLMRLLALEGFEVTCATTVSHPSWIRGSCGPRDVYRRRWCASLRCRWGQARREAESLFVVAKVG